jgi:hypothetical protein
MSYFQAVRLYSLVEVCIFTALLVVAIGGLGDHAELVLGWTHGVGWILLCVAVAYGCSRRVFPWALLAATVSPLGPVGSTVGLEYLNRRRGPPSAGHARARGRARPDRAREGAGRLRPPGRSASRRRAGGGR